MISGWVEGVDIECDLAPLRALPATELRGGVLGCAVAGVLTGDVDGTQGTRSDVRLLPGFQAKANLHHS